MARQAVRKEEAPAHGHTTTRKSSVWKDFDYGIIPGVGAMATCKRCGSMLRACSKSHGTSHLLRHAKSCCAKLAAKRVAPCLPAAAPAREDDEDLAKWMDDITIDPFEAGLFVMQEQLDSGTSSGSPFIDGRQMDGGGEVAVAGDNNPRFPNSMPDTRLPQVPSSSSKRFFQRKRERSAYLASHQRGATDKDHSSRENTDWASAVDNSLVYSDFTFEDAYD